MDLLRRWATLLDNAFRIPGTRFSVGLDPLLGLIPGIGDLTTPIFSTLLLLHAFKVGVPKIVQARMLLNVALDALLGWVPLAGDLFDFGWKANARNLRLVELHMGAPAKSTKRDWIFVGVAMAVVLLCALVPLLLAVWLLQEISAGRY
jgi:hypothetical protein